ncbi:hypothetical protein K432DRAFT_382846 [Lepidopterella palustris CBS 459.81]|uniref:Uncharacterized protein n=1 Tax=Lepidopterella palustris CBS 459.81 TaxID=1314670 RepID=A0A8E2JF48_9PEZI|nr:hypothetical protein K432DRAFT_382846 [Lepidopterella palustris CBS 459.81]
MCSFAIHGNLTRSRYHLSSASYFLVISPLVLPFAQASFNISTHLPPSPFLFLITADSDLFCGVKARLSNTFLPSAYQYIHKNRRLSVGQLYSALRKLLYRLVLTNHLGLPGPYLSDLTHKPCQKTKTLNHHSNKQEEPSRLTASPSRQLHRLHMHMHPNQLLVHANSCKPMQSVALHAAA